MKPFVALGVVVATAIGFVAGTLSSGVTLRYLDASAKASLLTHELRMLRIGTVEELLVMKEAELDGAIYHHARYINGVYPYFAWPTSMQYDHDKYMRSVLEYRSEFPRKKIEFPENITTEQRNYWVAYEGELESSMQLLGAWYGK